MKAFIMKHTSAFRLCLSLSIMAVLTLTPCMTGKAATEVGWQNRDSTALMGMDVIFNPANGNLVTGTPDTYSFEIPVTLTFNHQFVCGFPYIFQDNMYTVDLQVATASVAFDVWNNANYPLVSVVGLSAVSDSVSVQLGSSVFALGSMSGNRYGSAVVFPSDLGNYNAVTFFHTIDAMLCLQVSYRGQKPSLFSRRIGFSEYASLEMWNQRDQGQGYYVELMKKIDLLSANGAGIQGAIEHQTQQQHQDANNIMNGYDSTQGNASLGSFNEGIGKYEDAQSAITDSAYDNLDKFTIPGGGIGNMVAGLTASVPIASTMLQAIFQSSGDFTIIMTVTLILTITCMLLGIAKYYLR